MSRERSPSPILILDNGASTIKAGFAGSHEHGNPRLFPNNLARIKGEKRTFVSDELSSACNLSGVTYRSPFDRGYLMGWETEKPIWDRVFSQLAVEPERTSLFLTEAYNNHPALQAATDQMVFEHWGFRSLYTTTPAQLVSQSPGVIFSAERDGGRSYSANPQCVIVIDSGYSDTHVVPCSNGAPVQEAIRRIDVGGKLLTNHLKTLLSFRQYDLMDETHIVNEIKETCCFTSRNFNSDLKLCEDPERNPHRQEYVLPDFTSTERMKGFIKSGTNACEQVTKDPAVATNEAEREVDDQVLQLGRERFSVPEVVFNPSDIELPQGGLAEAVADSISALPTEIQGLYWQNVCLMGGNARIPNFAQRLKAELQQLSPTDLSPKVTINKDPVKTTYVAVHRLFSQPETSTWARENFARCAVTKQEYDELGSAGLDRKRRQVQDWGFRWAGWDG